MPDKIPVSFEIQYKDSPTKVTAPVSGVWGGNNYQGQIVAHFYAESRSFPSITKITLDPGNRRVEESADEAGIDQMTREVVASLVFEPRTAEAVGSWLLKHAQRTRDMTANAIVMSPKK